VALLVLLAPPRLLAWKDLSEDYVRRQVEIMLAQGTSPAARLKARWALVEAGRAAVYPLGQLARKHPELTWPIAHLLDVIRSDAEVVRIFSELLDSPSPGERLRKEIRGFLGSSIDDMLGVHLSTREERRAWIASNASYLVYDPAQFRFLVDEEARRRRRPLVPTPQRGTAHQAVDRAYGRLILALHLGNLEIVRAMVGPQVQLIRKQGRVDRIPALDLDAFTGPPSTHRALFFQKEGGRWIVRSARAYFWFLEAKPLCVEAGLKPVE
jgi:hypothetical protein